MAFSKYSALEIGEEAIEFWGVFSDCKLFADLVSPIEGEGVVFAGDILDACDHDAGVEGESDEEEGLDVSDHVGVLHELGFESGVSFGVCVEEGGEFGELFGDDLEEGDAVRGVIEGHGGVHCNFLL